MAAKHAADPASDAQARAIRTFVQGLLLDMVLAVTLVIIDTLHSESVDWRLLVLSIAKTALMSGASYVHRKLDVLRVGEETSSRLL